MAPPRNVPFVPSILEILSAQNMLPSQRRRHPWSVQAPPAQAPAQEAPEVTDMNTPLSLPHTPEPPDFSRFEMELEFVESLANPMFLNHIAARMYLNRPEFIAYLDYLQYWTEPPYLQFLTYPGPTLRHLELLQHERFRREIIAPDVAKMLEREAERGAIRWHKGNIYE